MRGNHMSNHTSLEVATYDYHRIILIQQNKRLISLIGGEWEDGDNLHPY